MDYKKIFSSINTLPVATDVRITIAFFVGQILFLKEFEVLRAQGHSTSIDRARIIIPANVITQLEEISEHSHAAQELLELLTYKVAPRPARESWLD